MRSETKMERTARWIPSVAIRKTDETINGLFGQISPGLAREISIVATGGYGRKELYPFSDIDLLVLHTRGLDTENIVKDIIYPLWDKGLNASYSVRTIEDCIEDAESDLTLLTSLFDARVVSGNDDLLRRLAGRIDNRITSRRKKLSMILLDSIKKRHETAGDAAIDQEPELKNARGGLRDYHSMLWLSRIIHGTRGGLHPDLVTKAERYRLEAAFASLGAARIRLHLEAGYSLDRLLDEYAGCMPPDLPRRIHLNALEIKTTGSYLFESIELAYRKRRIRPLPLTGIDVINDRAAFTPEPSVIGRNDMMNLFRAIAKDNLKIHPLSAKALFSARESLVPEDNDKKTFLGILREKHAGTALRTMLETGILEKIIPPVSAIKALPQPGSFHRRTVDLHCIETVVEAKKIEHGYWTNNTPFLLACLLHDVGKPLEKHDVQGEEIARETARQLGLSEKESETTAFLVRNHMAFPRVATGRDLTEKSVITEFAKRAGSPERLEMLYLLAIADSKATGPRAWNSWKASLMHELYSKSMRILTRSGNENALGEKWKELLARETAGPLWALPQAYIHATDIDEIGKHLEMTRSSGAFAMDVVHKDDHFHISITTKDRPGLFSCLSGIFFMNRLDILSAKAFTWMDSSAVDVFDVSVPWEGYDRWDRIEKQFIEASEGKLDIENELRSRKLLPAPSTKVSVRIDNEESEFFSLVEVTAPESPGLLYRISSSITSCGLDIHCATTFFHQGEVTDAFYVVTPQGEKILKDREKKKVELKIGRAMRKKR